jgi:hypothetical protein
MERKSKFRIQKSFFTVFMIALGMLGVLRGVFGQIVTPYTSSAHGDTSDGVNRSSMSIVEGHGYPKGHCAHCHEQHASVGSEEPAPDNQGPDVYLCFRSPFDNQESGFCLKCHKDQNSAQYQGYITNFDYSRRHGGESKTCPADIRTNFRFINFDTRLPQSNCGSSGGSAHDLKNIKNDALQNNWEWGSDRSVINPCLGCHSAHRAKRDYPCSLPSGHLDKSIWEIWGDEGGEKMADYLTGTEIYQPPNKVGAGTERDADTQPDYNTLCLECHQYPQTSFQHGTIPAINWTIGGDSHGKGVAGNIGPMWLEEPYGTGQQEYNPNLGKYVLCCTDCHEPHGSRNAWLLSTEVTGIAGIEVENPPKSRFCLACHAAVEGTPHNPPSCIVEDCHEHGHLF